MMQNAYKVVEAFERRVADHFGLEHGVAVDCCTSGLFLSLKYRQQENHRVMAVPNVFTKQFDHRSMQYDTKMGPFDSVQIPKRTYISVPFAIQDAGLRVDWIDYDWQDCGFYMLDPWWIADAAILWRDAKQYTRIQPNVLWCVSFHLKKPIPIGRGGMVLTNDATAAEWLRRARYDGREGKPYDQERVAAPGWHRYLTPEQAARGMALMDIHPQGIALPREAYPDLTTMPVFGGQA